MTQFAIYPSLRDRVVLVTGGGSGIGASHVEQFSAQGAKVGFIDINRSASEQLVAKIADAGHPKPMFFETDLRNIAAVKDSISQFAAAVGDVDVLLNNAAHDERHRIEDVTVEYWDDRIAVNLKHQFFAAQAVLPDMQAAKEGVIINFGSVSWMVGQGGMAAYTASKSAVLGLTRSLARDYGPDNIRVNAIAPGWIMTQRQIEKWLTPEGEAELMQRQCLKRKLAPDEIARFAVFLASEEASACTNQHYVVDGGWV